jgi:hypothetical protein
MSSWIDKYQFTILSHKDRLVGIFKEIPLVFFTFPQRLLHALVFRNVPGDAEDMWNAVEINQRGGHEPVNDPHGVEEAARF